MPGRKSAIFDLELHPSRPLRPDQVRLLLILVGVAFAVMALPITLLGAWPILPFMALAMALTLWALRESIRSGHASEHLRLDASGLELVRVPARGRIQCTHIEAGWAKVELEVLGPHENRLWLLARGKRIPFGSFLSPAERVEVAAVIEAGLHRFQTGAA